MSHNMIINSNKNTNYFNISRDNQIYLFSYPICPISFKLKILLKMLGLNYNDIVINNKFDFDSCVNKYGINSFPAIIFLKDATIEHKITIETPEFIKQNGTILYFPLTILKFFANNFQHEILSEVLDNYSIFGLEEFFYTNFHFLVYYKTVYSRTIKNIIEGISGFNVHESNIGESFMKIYLTEINQKLKYNKYLLSDKISIVDITAFSYISTLDYFNYVSWYSYIDLKNWYIKMCNNPGYNFIFQNYIYGVQKSETFGKFKS